MSSSPYAMKSVSSARQLFLRVFVSVMATAILWALQAIMWATWHLDTSTWFWTFGTFKNADCPCRFAFDCNLHADSRRSMTSFGYWRCDCTQSEVQHSHHLESWSGWMCQPMHPIVLAELPSVSQQLWSRISECWWWLWLWWLRCNQLLSTATQQVGRRHSIGDQ